MTITQYRVVAVTSFNLIKRGVLIALVCLEPEYSPRCRCSASTRGSSRSDPPDGCGNRSSVLPPRSGSPCASHGRTSNPYITVAHQVNPVLPEEGKAVFNSPASHRVNSVLPEVGKAVFNSMHARDETTMTALPMSENG